MANNIIGYLANGQPIYDSNPVIPMQSTPRLTAPMPNQQVAEQQHTASGMIWVYGKGEADSYRAAPGEAVVLWDKADGAKRIYIKSTDVNGIPQKMRVLAYEDITDSDKTEKVNHTGLSREEIDELINCRFNEMFDKKFKERNVYKKQHNQKQNGGAVNE